MSLVDAVRFFITESTRFVSPPAVAAEWVLVAIAAIVIASAPSLFSRAFQPARRVFLALANRRGLAILFCGLLPVAIRLSLLGLIPVPDPSIHDEFSHLLLADTLAHGRLTNPTHPLWEHFESIHIIQKPTYNSMYPPGQGVFLALGQVLFREPWAGVLISVGVMCAAVCWMMQGWLPHSWALFGGVIIALKLGVTGFWVNSYLGGAVPAIGGALLIGSLPRIRSESARSLDALLFGAGLVLLMNTRPFEGAVLGFAALLYLVPALAQRFGRNRAGLLSGFVLPAGAILLAGFVFTGYYSWRVTGSPLRMPYQVNRDTYGWPENLAFLPAKKVILQHKVLQDMYAKEIAHRDIYKSLRAFLDNLVTRIYDNWTVLIGPILTIPLMFLLPVFRDRTVRPLMLFIMAVAALNLLQMVLYPYHLGPVVPILFTLVAQGARQIYRNFLGAGKGRALYFVVLLPVCLMLTGAMKQTAAQLELPLSYWESAFEPHRDARAYIQEWLSARPRDQLVIVRYGPSHSPDQEWVYNRADIDKSKIVWAREMDPVSDARLLRYYPDREAWLLEADVYPQRVVHYPAPE